MAEAQEAPKISLAFGTKKPNQPTRTKRSHPSLQDSDNEDDGNKLVEVTHFDQAAGGAVDLSKPQEKGPLVIPAQKNRDWRDEARRKRQKGSLPSERQQTELDAIVARKEAEENQPAQYGLQIIEQQAEEAQSGKETEQESNETTPKNRKTEDELALEALLNGKPSSDLVLPAVDTEEDAFRRDFRNAPNTPTLEEYAAVPVEEFGAALLRGMGWRDGQEIGRRRGGQPVKLREVAKRPALLGIGAKESAATGVELGAWGKGAKNQRKVDIGYTPLSLKNKATGETISEEEYRKRLEQQKAVVGDGPDDRGSDREQRRRKYDRADDDRDRRRKDKDRDYDRYKSSRRGRDDPDEEYSRRTRRDDDRDYKHRSSKRDRSSSRRRRRDYSDESDHDRRDRERRRRDRDRDFEKRKGSYRRYKSPAVESDQRRRRDDSRERSYRDR